MLRTEELIEPQFRFGRYRSNKNAMLDSSVTLPFADDVCNVQFRMKADRIIWEPKRHDGDARGALWLSMRITFRHLDQDRSSLIGHLDSAWTRLRCRGTGYECGTHCWGFFSVFFAAAPHLAAVGAGSPGCQAHQRKARHTLVPLDIRVPAHF